MNFELYEKKLQRLQEKGGQTVQVENLGMEAPHFCHMQKVVPESIK